MDNYLTQVHRMRLLQSHQQQMIQVFKFLQCMFSGKEIKKGMSLRKWIQD